MGTTNNAYVPFQVAHRWVLVPANQVREVLGPQAALPLPGARPEIPGVVAWRGQAVPVIDLAPLLGLSGSPFATRARTLIVSHERSVAALPVDAAREVRSVADDAMRAIHADPMPYAIAETEGSAGLMSLIDLSAMLASLSERSGGSGV